MKTLTGAENGEQICSSGYCNALLAALPLYSLKVIRTESGSLWSDAGGDAEQGVTQDECTV